jgi:hypothetical protein
MPLMFGEIRCQMSRMLSSTFQLSLLLKSIKVTVSNLNTINCVTNEATNVILDDIWLAG